jgi:phenylphosphate carboxylase alpha subunit
MATTTRPETTAKKEGKVFKDIREFITALDKIGDVAHVKREVDWEDEIGAMVRYSNETQGPAVLLENIKDYPGKRAMGATLATLRRVNLAFGLPLDSPPRTLALEYGRRRAHPIKPVVVKDGPCKENIVTGNDIDLFNFPVPMVHDGDGGRYIGSWSLEISKDPDSDWTNWGMYRVMVYNKKYITVMMSPHKHIGVHLRRWTAKKKNMPVAIAIGADPLSSLAATVFLEPGDSEVDAAGGFMEKPVELVKCHTNELMVPATSEIVIEGEVMTDVTVPEGPFGEFTGHRSTMRPENLIKVTAITYRNDPILTLSCMGTPYFESSFNSITWGHDYEVALKKAGLPVIACYQCPELGSMGMAISVKRGDKKDVAAQIKNVFLAQRVTSVHKLFIVDEDVDVYNFIEVMHAFGARCHPLRGIRLSEEQSSHMIPNLHPDERKWGIGGMAVFDCTWPVDWDPDTMIRPKISFSTYPEELKDKVVRNAANDGLKK